MEVRNALSALLLASLVIAQDPPEPEIPEDPDPAVEDAADRVEDAWKDRRMERDGEAVAAMRELIERSKKPLHPDDRRIVLKTATFVLTRGKLREPELRLPYETAADLLAEFGEDGAKVLLQVYDRKVFPRKPDWEPMRAKLVEAIGKTKAEGVREFLLDVVTRSGENQVLKTAGAALGGYMKAGETERKEIVDKLAKRLAGFEGLASQSAVSQDSQLNLDAEAAKRTVAAVRDTWLEALARLTGEAFDTGVDWAKWYRDHRREPWPDRGDG